MVDPIKKSPSSKVPEQRLSKPLRESVEEAGLSYPKFEVIQEAARWFGRQSQVGLIQRRGEERAEDLIRELGGAPREAAGNIFASMAVMVEHGTWDFTDALRDSEFDKVSIGSGFLDEKYVESLQKDFATCADALRRGEEHGSKYEEALKRIQDRMDVNPFRFFLDAVDSLAKEPKKREKQPSDRDVFET